MCGIVAYVGTEDCRSFVLEGLSRLEYRGYDSAGFVCINQKNNHLSYEKAPGRLSCLVDKLSGSMLDGHTGMGHTRWATHGVATQENAHPHFDCHKAISLVHNGIIEHYQALREKLEKAGHQFYSDTDTEAVAHLLEDILPYHKTLEAAIVDLVSQIDGAFSLVFLLKEYPDRLVAIRRKSPLAIGMGQSEMFIASDPLVFADKTKKGIFLPDSSFAIIKKDHLVLYNFEGEPLSIEPQEFDVEYTDTTKQGFEHFMLKEIYEHKQSITKTLRSASQIDEQDLLEQIGLSKQQILSLSEIHLIGCGTSWHAACIAQFYFESVLGIPVRVHLASEFRYKPFFPQKNAVSIGISQSGETADTLEALRMLQSKGVPTIALTNSSSSTMVQEMDGFLLMQAGPEISVCSTKAFSAQLTSLYWLAHRFGLLRANISGEQYQQAQTDLLITAEILESSIERYKHDVLHGLAAHYAQFNTFIFLGRHIEYPFAQEAALKLKEISYVFAQAYPAGELKHGPIALIDQTTPVLLFSSLDPVVYQKLVASTQEVKARNGHVLIFAYEGQDELINLADNVFVFPRVTPLLGPLVMTGLMQYLMYEIARELNMPIDKPRNLAKSVTVE